MQLKGSCHCQAVKFSIKSHTPYPFMRCFCSICRKTAGGGGCYAINIMGEANTLKVTGKKYIKIYHAILSQRHNKISKSSGKRHFCGLCGSPLWISDSSWPQWIYPFASSIDTKLPTPPERVNIFLAFAANWCDSPKEKKGKKKEINFARYPKESIEEWHKRHHLYAKKKQKISQKSRK